MFQDEESIKRIHQRLSEIKAQGILDGEDADRSENLHRLFIYPAMMVPKTQRIIVEAFKEVLPTNTNVIDPFMGSGTSLISCMEFGYNIFGQDINPFAVMLAKTKMLSLRTCQYEDAANTIIQHISSDKSTTVDIQFANIDKWFTIEAQRDFSKIRRAIMTVPEDEIRYFFWVVMAETVRIGCNDRTSTFKLHMRDSAELASRHIDIIKEFCARLKRGIRDMASYHEKLTKNNVLKDGRYIGNVALVWGNSQQSINSDWQFDLLVSSPPYGDNQTTVTYGQTSYLPLQWIDPEDLECAFDYLKTTQEIDSQSLGGRKNKIAMYAYQNKLFDRTPTLAGFITGLPINEREKYDKTIRFINDFDECLDHIIGKMKPDAYYIWTIGNRFVGKREIPNSEILVDLMNYRGLHLFERAERYILNKKQPKKNNFSKTMEKEQILIFHK